jgi:hypothetical protein
MATRTRRKRSVPEVVAPAPPGPAGLNPADEAMLEALGEAARRLAEPGWVGIEVVVRAAADDLRDYYLARNQGRVLPPHG